MSLDMHTVALLDDAVAHRPVGEAHRLGGAVQTAEVEADTTSLARKH